MITTTPRYCETCGASVAPATVYCENCGHALAAAPRPPARRRPPRPVIAAAVAALIAAATVVALLVAGVLGDDDQTTGAAVDQPVAGAPATPGVSALDPLPRHDQADGYMDLDMLDGAVTLAAGHPRSDPGITDWAVYALPGRDARLACDEVADAWIHGPIGLGDDFTDDPQRARALGDHYRATPGGCRYSFLENTPSSPAVGPSRWDIAVRAFAKADPLTHDPQAVRTLGAITPQPAPIYEGPYSEVSIVHAVGDTSEPFADGRPASSLGSKRIGKVVACDANISVSDGGCAFANNVFWTYWTRGQVASINVYDADRGRFRATSCDLADEEVTCSTGSTVVSFPQAAVDLYDQGQADRYAATHDVG
jgi:hypothetical protein